MNKRFVFVNLSIESGFTGVNHGIAYLVPIIKKAGFNVFCLNIVSKISCNDFRNRIEKLCPSIVAFSCTSPQLKYLAIYSKALGIYPEILQIAGGVGSTLDPEVFLNCSDLNGVCIGEGEMPIKQLLSNINNNQDIYSTEGFFWKQNGQIIKNRIAQFINDLSSLDFPDYSIFDRNLVVRNRHLNLMMSRGCPFNCNYCCNGILSNVYPSRLGYFRIPSVEYSIRFLEFMNEQYPETEFIGFEDDLLIANKAWFIKFAEEYQKRIKKPYRICVRIECIDPEIVEAMKKSGCRVASSGLESGNERLRNELLNRKHSNSMYIEKSKMIKDAGIELFTFNIVGFPFETKQEMEETFKLNKILAPNYGLCTFFYPFPKTKLYNICKQEGLLEEEEIVATTNYNTRPTIKMTQKQARECISMQRRMTHYFIKRRYWTLVSYLPHGIKWFWLVGLYFLKYLIETRPLLGIFVHRLKSRFAQSE
ncbi:MAG: radical SAM protein [Candidatus Saganbacteria bacterium]|uniref:Radical SAM protein n=1 Tax=Candidatus Saganbacteria bacterium TaxID=2575572 RepID=A0A833L2E7_UNCSA|nr:MAG: radical SAM protein [Candidatus Saganbacteria bacterium]